MTPSNTVRVNGHRLAGARSARRRVLPLVALALTGLATCDGDQERSRGVPGFPTVVPEETTTTTGLASSAPPSTGRVPLGRGIAVEQVVDGNSLVVTGGRSVRLIFVEAPTPQGTGALDGCYGAEAARHLTDLLPRGTEVRLVDDDIERTDPEGRPLVYLYRLPDELFVNAALVRGGYARIPAVSGNRSRAYEFVALQREARAARRGLWGKCSVGETPTTSTAPETTTTTTGPPSPTTTRPSSTTTTTEPSTTTTRPTTTTTEPSTTTTTTTEPPTTTTTTTTTEPPTTTTTTTGDPTR